MTPTALTEMVDRVFNDRYRIEELVGIGALSAVYSAYDPIEGRWVALKVFDYALGADERFVQRLLEAAEQAAVLNHPNIAQIYDWGVDGGPFIVSELCEGGSLAALLAQGHVLESSQALVMTLECARALNHGHEQGAIHRNLTPRNILFTDDQHVRISDYGLARVLADAPVSHAVRALENVRYASPEQARGRPVGEASDLYSLALVVSESVSNQPPAVAETVVGTLMERAESSAHLDPALAGLLPPLERCGRVDPEQRPEAEELAIALLATAETMARPEALPLVGIGSVVVHEDLQLRVAGGTKSADASTDPALTDHAVAADAAEPGDMADPGDTVEPGDMTGPDDLAEPGMGTEPSPPTQSQPESTPGLVLADDDGDQASDDVQVTVPGLSGIKEDSDTADQGVFGDSDVFDITTLGELDDFENFADEELDEPDALLPDPLLPEPLLPEEPTGGGLEDLELAQPAFVDRPDTPAQAALDVPEQISVHRTALAYQELHDDADDRLPWWPLLLLGLVVAALVAAGVYFFVLGESSESAEVPDLIGVQFDELGDRVAGRDWQIEKLENRLDGAVAGSIISQSPAPGSELDDNGQLTVTVSLGNAMVEIPSDIVGLSVDQAASRLSSVGLALGNISEVDSESLEAGLVVSLDEPTTQMPRGEVVDLRISTGPQDRIVPGEVLGMTIGDATSLLVGLRLQAVEEPVFDPDAVVGLVLGMSPAAGQVVPADTAVTLLVSAGPEPVEMPDIIGLPLDEAVDVITELGLIFIDSEGTPGEDVIGSLPPIGATVDVGTEVTIILADPAEEDDG